MTTSSNDSPNNQKMEEFVALYAANQRQIYRYLAGLLPTQADIEDVMQETSVVLWREFEQFELGTNFAAWSYQIAFNQVRAWRKRQKRDRLVFSERFIEVISKELAENITYFDERDAAMKECVKKLTPEHQQILKSRYAGERSVESLAQEFHRTSEAIYRLLSRIRHTLHDCIDRAVSRGEIA